MHRHAIAQTKIEQPFQKKLKVNKVNKLRPIVYTWPCTHYLQPGSFTPPTKNIHLTIWSGSSSRQGNSRLRWIYAACWITYDTISRNYLYCYTSIYYTFSDYLLSSCHADIYYLHFDLSAYTLAGFFMQISSLKLLKAHIMEWSKPETQMFYLENWSRPKSNTKIPGDQSAQRCSLRILRCWKLTDDKPCMKESQKLLNQRKEKANKERYDE